MNKTSVTDLVMLYGVTGIFCLGLFFFPLLTQQKEPAVQQAVIQNMVFFQEMITNYIKHNQNPPTDIPQLIKNARLRNYNKTLFNPINKYTGDADNSFVLFQYKAEQINALNRGQFFPDHAGKVGYYTSANHYVIYGVNRDGSLLTQDGKVYSLGNY